jgi:hypothetical protein
MKVLVALPFEVCAVASIFKNLQSKEGKREKRLINPAHHNSSILLPVRNIAVVLQRRAHVPGQKAPADSPDKGKEAINRNVEIGPEADAAVQHNSHGQCRDGEERRCHKLEIKISISIGKIWVLMSKKLPVQKSTASASDRASSAT